MSIRGKIVASFLSVIVLLIISLVSVFIFHLTSVWEYKEISDALILENTLTSSVADLMEAYNAVSVAPSSSDRINAYEARRRSIQDTFTALDVAVVSSESKIAYQGLKNIIQLIIEDLDTARTALESGDIVAAGKSYDEAVRKKAYVETNVTSLVLSELQNLHKIQEKIEEKYRQQLILVMSWIFVVVVSTTLYAVVFARRITHPIKVLSEVSEKVSAGNYSYRISEDLLARNDEVGTLASSLNTMLDALNDKISQVEKAHATILATQKDVEHRNAELEKFNAMVIGRELKMVELKEKIAHLERELNSTHKTTSPEG